MDTRRDSEPVSRQKWSIQVDRDMGGMRPRATSLSALIIALLLGTMLAAACGGSSATSPATTPAGPESTSAATATATSAVSSATATSDATANAATPSATASPVGSPVSSGTTVVSLYFLRDGKLATARRTLPKTQQIGTAALNALKQGPNDAEQTAGLTSAIPGNLTLQGLKIANGVATADVAGVTASNLPPEAAQAQVVYTLTQFPSIKQVQFSVSGMPVPSAGHTYGRSDFEDVLPAIFVESPAFGDTVASPLHVSGTANTFEATFFVSVVDGSGKTLVDQQVTATAGSGTRGTFSTTLSFSVAQAGPGKLVAYEKSAKDGSKINVVEIPVQLTK